MTESSDLLAQVFQQYGLVGLIVFFLITGPGYTYLRTKSLRAQGEARAQALVNDFAKQERLRAERLEAQLNANQQKLDTAEEEVAHLHLKLSEAKAELEVVASLRRQVRTLRKRVTELECAVEQKKGEIENLRSRLELREQSTQPSTEPPDQS